MKVGGNKGEDDDRGCGQQVNRRAVSVGKKDGEEAGPESNPKDAFIHVGDRWATRDPDAGGKPCQQEEQAEVCKGPAPREETMLRVPSCEQKKNRGKKPGDPCPAEGVKVQVGDFGLDFGTGKNSAPLLFKKLIDGKRDLRERPGRICGGSAGWRDHTKRLAGGERGEKADAKGDILGGGGKGRNFTSGTAGAGEFGLAGELCQFGNIGQLSGGKEANILRQGELSPKGGVVHKENGFVLPAFGADPDGEDELAGADPAEVGKRDGGATAHGGGDFPCEGEEGFDPAAVLNGEGVESGVILCQAGGGLRGGRHRGQPKGEIEVTI